MSRITPKAVNNEQQLDRRIKEIERQVQSFPVRNVGGAAVSINWIRVDGGQELNELPEVTGIKAGALPAAVPADLDPGAVDSAGVETEAPTGTFPDGVGYGTLYGSDGTVRGRRLVRLEGTTVISGWTFYAGGSVAIDDDATPEPGSKTFLVVNNA